MTPDELTQLIKRHRPFYEVSSFELVVEEGHGTPTISRRRVPAGFDVDIYGARAGMDGTQAPDYALACAALRQIAASTDTDSACSIEVVPFHSTVFLNTRDHLQPEAMIRIRISHRRGPGEPAGVRQQQALEQVERQLRSLGITRR